MLRLFRNILCSLLLLLFLFLLVAGLLTAQNPIALWYKHTDAMPLNRSPFQTPHFYYAMIYEGRLILGDHRDPDYAAIIRAQRIGTATNVMALQQIIDKQSHLPGNKRTVQELITDALEHLAEIDAHGFDKPDGVQTSRTSFHNREAPASVSFLGLSYESRQVPATASLIHRLVIPLPLLLPFLLLWPLLRAVSIFRTHRRLRTNHCPTCGYDLRATPTICPECGHTKDAALSL